MRHLVKRMLGALFLLALVITCFAQVQAADRTQGSGRFALTVLTDSETVIAPVYIPYTEGQTVQQALMASNYTFEGLEQGYIYAVENVADNYYIFYDNGGYNLQAPASGITVLCLLARPNAYSEAYLDLVNDLAYFATLDTGVQKYEAAAQAYRTAVDSLRTADAQTAASLQAELAAAVEQYNALQNGTKYTVQFQITQAGAAVSNAQLTLTDAYGNVTTATGNQISVISGNYDFVVSDGGCNRTEGTLTVQDANLTVALTLPSGQWFECVDLLCTNTYAEENFYQKTTNGSNAATYYLPDTVRSSEIYIYAVQGAQIPSSTTKLRLLYTGTDGVDYAESAKAWSSARSAFRALVAPGMEGRTVEVVGKYTDENGYTLIQSYAVTVVRTPTLERLTVTGDGTKLPLAFAPDVFTYSVSTVSDTLKVDAAAFGAYADGYSVAINGTAVAEGESSTVALNDNNKNSDGTYTIPVTVRHTNGQSATYEIVVTKVESVQVVLEKASGISLALQNAAGAEISPLEQTDTQLTYALIPGQAYTYTTTKNTYYHACATFTASQGLRVHASTPVTTDWLSEITCANGTTAAQKVSNAYTPDQAFTASRHAYTYAVSDCNSLFGLWAALNDGVQDATITAYYTMRSDNSAMERKVTSGKSTAAVLSGFVQTSGYSNTAVVRVSQAADGDGVTYYQDYALTVHRTLHLYDLSVFTDGTELVLKQEGSTYYDFDRDYLNCNVQVPRATQQLDLTLRFPETAQGEGTYGGYTATLTCGEQTQTLEYAHMTDAAVQFTLDTSLQEEEIHITVQHVSPDAVPQTYVLKVTKLPPVAVRVQADPEEAVVSLTETLSGKRVWPRDDGAYELLQDYTYAYTVTCAGYVAQSGTFTADKEKTVEVALTAAQPNETLPTDLESEWPDFRGGRDNNGVTDAATPISAEDTVLYWANKLGEGYDNGAVGCPILVDDFIYTYAGNHIYKVDKLTGQTVAEGEMDHASSFAINSPTYADGMIFVGLSNGGVQAFNAETLESLWLYEDVLGGQPNCPITYCDGYIYTGFWNSEVREANYVCLSVTDEDPTQPLESKAATWTYTHKGGFYWSGCYACGDFVLVGTDDGKADCLTGYAKLLSFDPRTGRTIDEVTLPNTGDIRCSISYDAQTDAYYFTSKAGYFYSVKMNDDGTINKNTLKYLKLSNGSENPNTPPLCSASPAIYNGRAYVGVSGTVPYGMYSGHNITVIDLASWSVAYRVPTQGYPQTSGLLTTAYEESEGVVYVYFFDNYIPGKLRVISDAPGQRAPVNLVTETYTASGKTHAVQCAYTLFTPDVAQAEYTICSPIVDSDGTIYYKNDSGYLMAVGSTITSLDVVSLPDKTRYEVGETFDPAGMQVIATYANGTQKDVTAYLTYATQPLSADDTEFSIRFEHVEYQDKDGTAGVDYDAPEAYLTLRFGAATQDEQAAEAVERLISAIGIVTKEKAPAITQAREAYDALAPAQQRLVQNSAILTAAEEQLARLNHAHSYGAWTSNQNGTHSRFCDCGQKQTENCTYTQRELTPATTTQEGVMQYTCTACAYQYTQAIPMLQEQTNPFTDVKEGTWYYEGVLFAAERELVKGFTDGTFRPNESMTRGQLVTVLYRMEGSPEVTFADLFNDVADGRYYAKAVIWANSVGIVKGYSDSTFRPDLEVTREQIAAFLHRYAVYKAEDVSAAADLTQYQDYTQVSKYAQEAMSWANAEQLIKGMATGLKPQDHATRAQVATILMRYLQRYEAEP